MEETKTCNEEYSWDSFTQDVLYKPLIEFFNNITANPKCDIVFVSRKAYCLFLLMREKKAVTFDGFYIYTDRAVASRNMPLGNESEMVILVDDTIRTGDNLYEACLEVVKKTNYRFVALKVFLGDEDFDENGFRSKILKLQNTFLEKFIDFELFLNQEKLYKKLGLMNNEIASMRFRFSAIETLLFHENGIPYCAELPILGEKLDGRMNSSYEILFTIRQYQMLQEDDGWWKFFKCDQMGYRQKKIENAVFIMKDGPFYGAMPEFIHDFVIRAQINKRTDGRVGIVFSPFAILKSVKYNELEDFFFHVFRNTSYARIMQNKKEKQPTTFKCNYYKTLYRAIVYVYSYCAGYIFKNYLEQVTNMQIGFQEKDNVYCYEPAFISSVKMIFMNGVNDLFLNTYLFKGFTDVENIVNVNNITSKYGRISNTYSGVYYFLWSTFNELKRVRGIKADIGRKSFLSLEELQEAIYKSSSGSFDFDTLKDTFTACLCAMLEQSKITNEFYFDEEHQIVYRGFKYAENGEATFELQEKIMFIAVRAYLMKLIERGFTQKEIEEDFLNSQRYRIFLLMLQDWLLRNNLWNTIITPEAFSMYSEHYRKSIIDICEKLDFLVENKKPAYVSMIEEYVYSLQI